MEERLSPIYSLLADVVDLEDAIDGFVIRLAESVDELQDAECSGDLERLEELSTSLAAESARLGYPALEKLARLVRGACEERNKPVIQASLIELTDVARRVRLGHRGAA
jgi:hypothetical protein